eukprot:scaffold3736_cov103-Cylindrotheca_fusiformis.AAC.7
MSNGEEDEPLMEEEPAHDDVDADIENREPKQSGDNGKEAEDGQEAGEEDEKQDEAPEPKMALRVEIQNEEEEPQQKTSKPVVFEDLNLLSEIKEENLDPKVQADLEYIRETPATTKLEKILLDSLKRKDAHLERLTGEISKLKAFISKRKQTYKRKRKDEGAPTRALSAYNIFVQDRFAKLAKENEAALKSTDSDAQMKRVPPANLVSSTGNLWKELPPEEKARYEERAKTDRKRYEEQMAQYQPPDKQANRKRNKTGYNMFFSAHVLRLKQSEMGVPSERGSVARLVGTAWKEARYSIGPAFVFQQLSAEEKQYYEREADKHNGMNPVEKEGEEDEDEEAKRQADHHGYLHPSHEMHMHGGMPPPIHPMHQPPQHDPRHHGYYPPHMYGQPAHGYYDYGHHPQTRHQHGARPQGYSQTYPPQHGQAYAHDQRM